MHTDEQSSERREISSETHCTTAPLSFPKELRAPHDPAWYHGYISSSKAMRSDFCLVNTQSPSAPASLPALPNSTHHLSRISRDLNDARAPAGSALLTTTQPCWADSAHLLVCLLLFFSFSPKNSAALQEQTNDYSCFCSIKHEFEIPASNAA